jgi:hypothetical protein
MATDVLDFMVLRRHDGAGRGTHDGGKVWYCSLVLGEKGKGA